MPSFATINQTKRSESGDRSRATKGHEPQLPRPRLQRFRGRRQTSSEAPNIVIPSEARNPSFTGHKSRGIPRFARNDGSGDFWTKSEAAPHKALLRLDYFPAADT